MTLQSIRVRQARRLMASVAAIAMGSSLGCLSSQPECADNTQGLFPQPNGTYLNYHNELQIDKAKNDKFVVYQYEWLYDDPTVLGPFGSAHVSRMARWMNVEPRVALIQPSDDQLLDIKGRKALDELRRTSLVIALGENGLENPASRVIIAYPFAEGLYGDEAQKAYYQLILGSMGMGGGFGGGGFGGGQGGFGGGGFGGGGFGGGGFGGGGFGGGGFGGGFGGVP